jgi:Flp pilus assembly protein CpaB
MRRSPRVFVAWAVAVIVAVATARFVAADLTELHRRARRLGPDVPVVLATHDLVLGATVTPADLQVVIRPASTVNPDALHEVADGAGRVVASGVHRDDVMRERDLVRRDRVGGVVPVGRRAVHVVVKDGFRPPAGAVVDVLAAFEATAGGRAEVVAGGARVLDVDEGTGSAGGENDVTGSGITLLVTEDEARAVAYAGSFGALSVALAPPESACCGP